MIKVFWFYTCKSNYSYVWDCMNALFLFKEAYLFKLSRFWEEKTCFIGKFYQKKNESLVFFLNLPSTLSHLFLSRPTDILTQNIYNVMVACPEAIPNTWQQKERGKCKLSSEFLIKSAVEQQFSPDADNVQ